MDPTRDNPLIRIKAFIDGLGIFTFFAVVLLIIIGLAAAFGLFSKGETPEDAAGDIRYETKTEVDAAQAAFLTPEQISAAIPEVSKELIASKPVAVEKAEQIVPGSETALNLENAPAVDTTEMDAAAEGDADAPIDPAVLEKGKAQYIMCIGCHGENGQGVESVAPPLAESEWVTGPISNLIKIQLRGLAGPIEVNGRVYEFANGMLPMAYQTNEQIADVLTYVRNSFGNKASAVKPEQVEALRSEVGKPQVTVEELTKP
ncbi:MAG: cytochrome c [Akkermansiaceae bacterium]|jgi:mono/diheme cytochrome c family protein|nr:cytochrome c [Akkermansiaceae bacterium]MDP4722462.1 cytochrome c [Akkermansiaceae bacterium]MDP4778628.1 cytochrome c [Akkermansiaceae bacterium]MDP4848323.1 cytochrome c [Akkermansiaceae bacterium]MDP4899193.1 cytochrome c [Akkermansiaceae bacterium]